MIYWNNILVNAHQYTLYICHVTDWSFDTEYYCDTTTKVGTLLAMSRPTGVLVFVLRIVAVGFKYLEGNPPLLSYELL